MDNFFTKSLSLALLTMPAWVLTIHHGASLSAKIILLLSLIILVFHYPIHLALNKKEKIFIFSLICLPVVVAFDVTLRGLNLRYLDYYLRFILVIPIYFALRETKVTMTPLMTGILIGSIGAGIFALYQNYYLNNPSLGKYSSLGYMIKINYGNISLLLGMLSLAGLFIINELRFKKTFYIITLLAFILGITGSLLSGSRGGWIAIPFCVGLFIMYFPTQKINKIIGTLIFIMAILITYYANPDVKSRTDLAYHNTEAYFSNEKTEAVHTSTGARYELWRAAWIMFTEHPVFGIGSGEVRQILKKKIDSGEIKKIKLYDHVHNEPLQILITTGIVGLSAYLILYAGISYYFYRSLITSSINKVRYLSFLGIMTTGAYFIFGLTNYSFGHHVMVLFFAVMVAIFAGVISNIENNKNSSDSIRIFSSLN